MSQNTIITLLGRKGSGKSTLTAEIIRESPRVVILDYLGEYGANVKAQVVTGFRPALDALVEASGERRFRLSLRIEDEDLAMRILPVAWELSDYLLVVEEASAYCSPTQIPPELARMVRFGRHQRISQLYVAQRPSMLHRHITSQSDLIISFRQHEPIDVRYLRMTAGEAADAVQTLPDYAIFVSGALDRAPLAVLARLGKRTKIPPTSTQKVLAPDPTEGVNSEGRKEADPSPS